MSDSDLQIGNHPNILQHIRDLVEFHAYMRNSESITVAFRLHGDVAKDSRVHIRIQLCQLYLELCSQPVSQEMIARNVDESSLDSSSANTVGISEYTPDNWDGVYQDLQRIRSCLYKSISLVAFPPKNPHKFFRYLVTNAFEEELGEISTDEARELTEEQASIMGDEFDEQLDRILFQQALSIFRLGEYDTESVVLFKNLIKESRLLNSCYHDLLLGLLEGDSSSLKFKDEEEIIKLIESDPYSLAKYQENLATFLSKLENTMLPKPILITLGYSEVNQPGYIDETEDEGSSTEDNTEKRDFNQNNITETENPTDTSSLIRKSVGKKRKSDDEVCADLRESLTNRNKENDDEFGENESDIEVDDTQAKVARKALKEKRNILAKHKDPLAEVISASNKVVENKDAPDANAFDIVDGNDSISEYDSDKESTEQQVKSTRNLTMSEKTKKDSPKQHDDDSETLEKKIAPVQGSSKKNKRDSIASTLSPPTVKLSKVNGTPLSKNKSPTPRKHSTSAVASNGHKRRAFSEVEDLAIIDGVRKFENETNIWASIRDYYVVFSGKFGHGERSSVQIKDRFRTLLKNGHKFLLVTDKDFGAYKALPIDKDIIPQSTTAYRLRMQAK